MFVGKYESESMWGDFLVYAYKSGKATLLLDKLQYGDWTSYKIYRKSKSFVAYGDGHDGEGYSYFKLSGGKCTEVACKYQYRLGASGSLSAWTYYKLVPYGSSPNLVSIGVSKSKFNRIVSELVKGGAVKVKGTTWKKADGWRVCA